MGTVKVVCRRCKYRFNYFCRDQQKEFEDLCNDCDDEQQSDRSSTASNELKPTEVKEYSRISPFCHFGREEMKRLKDKNPSMTTLDACLMIMENWAEFGYQWCVNSLRITGIIDDEKSFPAKLEPLSGGRPKRHPEASSSAPQVEVLIRQSASDYFIRAELEEIKAENPGITDDEAKTLAEKNWSEFGYYWCFDNLRGHGII